MLFLQNISYLHQDREVLFENLSLTINQHDKVALIGNNGSGKSTLLKIIANELQPSSGNYKVETQPYYVPQVFGQFNHLTIAQALRIADKLHALQEILEGDVTEENMTTLEDDWSIEERSQEALRAWGLSDLELTQKMALLSGGQKTRVFLAGITIHQPELVLLDEPSNHLDSEARQLLYNFIQSTSRTLVVVSHDRKLLNLLDTICELTPHGITVYGGNYDFYQEQKEIAANALQQDIQSREKALRKAREKERETNERQQKLDARGKKKQENAGVARIMMNTLRNNAENSSSKLKNVHAEKIGGIAKELQDLRATLPELEKMKFGLDNSGLHKGKLLFDAKGINYSYAEELLWNQAISFQITSGSRIALKGGNGSGKTTLIRMLLGEIEPTIGELYCAQNRSVYIDQEYSLIDNASTVLEQAQRFNTSGLQEHEVKIRLNRFLFPKEEWGKSCVALSGGEKMRLLLCCLTIGNHAPDLIILDEPTNNLDLQNIEILTEAINEYQGTLIVVSHDESFLTEIGIERNIQL